jgi:hypothetical protein
MDINGVFAFTSRAVRLASLSTVIVETFQYFFLASGNPFRRDHG